MNSAVGIISTKRYLLLFTSFAFYFEADVHFPLFKDAKMKRQRSKTNTVNT
jgi:hypothetical protein